VTLGLERHRASATARGWLLACVALLLPAWAAAQQTEPPNGLLLVARPELRDPNFARTVVLVTQTADGGTVGVILNRPTRLRLNDFLSSEFTTANYDQPIYLGGPVMRQALVCLFRTESVPRAPAFHVLRHVYLTMHPDNIERLLADPAARYRLYAGFSGWAPRQLESEFAREGWYVLPADEATLFRDAGKDKEADRLWEELVERAKGLAPRT